MDDLDFGATIKGFSPGQKILNRYTLQRILGRGGMGVVWLARDEELEREVALKFLPEVVAADKEAVKELKRETRRSLELTHSHIIRIYDFLQDARTAAISMEYVAGDTLSSRKADLERGCFEPEEIAAWVGQLCSALDYAHGKAQIVHRDLKPANLMVDSRGDLKVADFGIASSVADSVSRVSKQAGSSGTPVYMSPQQMMGEKPAVTDDIYALGATLYDLLTGKPPFHSGNIVVQVQSKTPLSLAARRAELGRTGAPIPAAWEATIAACLAKDPAERPQSAGEVAERLGLAVGGGLKTEGGGRRTEDAQAGKPVARVDPNARASAAEGGLGSSRSTSKAPLFAGIAAAVLVVAGLGWYFGVHQPEQRRLAEIARLEAAGRAAEALKLKNEQEKAAAEKARHDSLAAEIKALTDSASIEQMDAMWERVDHYSGSVSAPESFKLNITELWSARQTAWTNAQNLRKKEESERLAAERLAAARGGIAIRTNPAGAEVRVGAIALDKSPLTLKDQKLGKYPVRVRLDGYEDWSGELEVKENEFADLAVTLVRSTGTLSLASEPAGLEVEVIGRAVPGQPAPASRQTTRTPAELKLPTGTYDLTFRRQGWSDQTHSIEIARNQTASASAEFIAGSIELTSSPSGAEVWQNGQRVGTTPFLVKEVVTGPYVYELRFSGHESQSVRGVVEPRSSLRLSAVLEKIKLPEAGRTWENTLGQKFVPVPGTGVLFSIWETRVQDFEAFVRATGHDATAGMHSDRGDGWRQQGDTWKSPGFPQGPTHPVVGVNRADAEAFCRWLTDMERRKGRLAPGQQYRLPTDAEWNAAVGSEEFPWGNQWPPPHGAGNYADEAVKRGRYSRLPIITGYDDGYETTAPVGSFTANRHGIFDLGGNAWEFVGNGTRGGSFYVSNRGALASSAQGKLDRRDYDFGFRVVCVVGSAPASSSASVVPTSGESFRIPELALDMMPIAPGRFAMGSANSDQGDERPVTQVTISRPFWLGKTEVMQAQWEALMGSNPSKFKGANLPVEQVNWVEAMAFCRKLTERERVAGRLPDGYAYTLPTEAQWEYACRAGTTGDYAGNLDAMGWYNANSGNSTKPVGQKQANAWGLHDMHGNVWEWCLDWYGNYPGGSMTDPTGPGSGSLRVFRGGGWGDSADSCRTANRVGVTPDGRWSILGFRVALTPSR